MKSMIFGLTLKEETWMCLLLAATIFLTEFLVISVMNIAFPVIFNIPLELILLNASILVIVIYPLLSLLRRKLAVSNERLKKLNDILRAIRSISELISRESDIEKLLSDSCKLLQDVKEYFHVAIYESRNSIIKKVVESGGESSPGKEELLLCVKKAIKERKPVIFDNKIYSAANLYHKQKNSGSVIVIPFYALGKDMVLTISSNLDHFYSEEVELLKEVAEDLGFAIDKCVVEEDRRKAFEQLASNLRQFDNTADKLRNPLAVIISSIELKNELGVEKALEIIDEHAKKIEKNLNEMRAEEIRTYRLVEELEVKN